MLEFTGVSKAFGREEILKNINFRLKEGDILCISGLSGCGKSTILNISAGMLRADRGAVERSSSRIGYAFQNDIFLPWMTAGGNLQYILKGYYTTGDAYERCMYWLGALGLSNDVDKYPHEMSGGMKKRLGIARAFSIEPDICLLDEPFAYLDHKNADRIRDIILNGYSSKYHSVIMTSNKPMKLDSGRFRLIEVDSKPVVIV